MFNDCGGSLKVKTTAEQKHTAFVLIAALAARLLVLAQTLAHLPVNWFYTRGSEMGLLAASIVRGEGLSSPFGPPTGPTAMIAPGYPLLVAGIFRLFGCYSTSSAFILLAVNLFCNVITVWLILCLSRRYASEWAAMAAASFWACSPAILGMPTIFWETNLSVTFLLGAVIYATIAGKLERRSTWFSSGAGCGIAALFNPALLPSLVCIFAWRVARARERLRRTLLFLCGLILVYLPWPTRNEFALHAPVLSRTTVGLELWMGNHPGADGYLNQAIFPTYNGVELADYRMRGELGYMGHKQQLAFQWIASTPGTFFNLTSLRFMRFWNGTGSRLTSPVCFLHAMLTTTFGFFGLALLFKSRDRGQVLYFLLPLVLFPLPYYLTHAELRYRLVLDPLLTVLAARTIQNLPWCFVSKHKRGLPNSSGLT